MRNEQHTNPQWICTHCFIHLANGDCTEPDECPETWSKDSGPLHLFWGMNVSPGMLAEYHECAEDGIREDGCDCETKSFSWSACDGCGSSLGGERHAVTGWIQEGSDASTQ